MFETFLKEVKLLPLEIIQNTTCIGGESGKLHGFADFARTLSLLLLLLLCTHARTLKGGYEITKNNNKDARNSCCGIEK